MNKPNTALVLSALLAIPNALPAQDGLRLEVTPHAGVAITANEIGRAASLDDGNYLRFDRIGPAVALGISARATRPGSRWHAHATLVRALEGAVDARWDCDDSSDEACPSILVQPPSSAAMTVATVGLTHLPTLWTRAIRPFATVGAGLKAYSFEWEGRETVGPGFSAGSETRTSFTLQVGAGAEWTWRGVAAVVQIEDFASWLTTPGSGLKHDLALTAGGRLRMF